MPGSGHWGAGFVSPEGVDLVFEESEAGLRPRMGTMGSVGQAPHGEAADWRTVWSIPLAYARNLMDWFRWNANPGTAEDMLPEWEDALRVPRGDPHRMTVAERQARLKARIGREIGHPTLGNLTESIRRIQEAATGYTDAVGVDDNTGRIVFWVHLYFYQEIVYNPENPYVQEVQSLLHRFMPAGIGWTFESL